jgi:hypothetical protein
MKIIDLTVVGALAAILASCAPSASAPTSPAVQAAAPPPPPAADDSALPASDQLWDVTKIRCESWVDASDDDRAAVGMFYYGWLAGNRRIQAIRPIDIQPNLRKVLDVCGQNRSLTIVRAFEMALKSNNSR